MLFHTQTVKEALQRASFCLQKAGIDLPFIEAEILLAHILKTDRLQLFLNQDKKLSLEDGKIFQEAIYRRCEDEPSAYITGEKYFYGNRFIVNQDVLIPRPETELIIESVLEWADWLNEQHNRQIKCIDLGTGSGVLAVTAALLFPRADIWAVDYSMAALQTAKLNAQAHKVKDKINWLLGSYFDVFSGSVPKPKFNLIISNPPYLTLDDLKSLPKQVKQFEPVDALYGGKDGLDSYRLILSKIKDFAALPALMVMEVGAGQRDKIDELCSAAGFFSSTSWRYDYSGWPRVFVGVIS